MTTCVVNRAAHKRRAILGSAIVLAVAFAAASAEAAVTPPKSIADKGTIVYCSDLSFPPLEYFDPKTNQPAGFEVDLGAAVAKEMGVKSEFKNVSFDGIIPALQAGQCDAILSGLYDKPNRREVLDFVDYAYLGNSVIVRADSNLSVKSLEELSGKTAATETGTQLELDLKKANENLAKAGTPPIKIVAFPKMSDAFQQLLIGLVDVFYTSTIQAGYYNEKNEGSNQVKVASPQMSALYVGIATLKTQKDLHDAIDAAFKDLLANGEYDKIVKQWKLESIAQHP